MLSFKLLQTTAKFLGGLEDTCVYFSIEEETSFTYTREQMLGAVVNLSFGMPGIHVAVPELEF